MLLDVGDLAVLLFKPEVRDNSDGFVDTVREDGSSATKNDMAVLPRCQRAGSVDLFPSAAGGSSRGVRRVSFVPGPEDFDLGLG